MGTLAVSGTNKRWIFLCMSLHKLIYKIASLIAQCFVSGEAAALAKHVYAIPNYLSWWILPSFTGECYTICGQYFYRNFITFLYIICAYGILLL